MSEFRGLSAFQGVISDKAILREMYDLEINQLKHNHWIDIITLGNQVSHHKHEVNHRHLAALP